MPYADPERQREYDRARSGLADRVAANVAYKRKRYAEDEEEATEVTPYLSDADFTLYCGDARSVLAELPAESVHMLAAITNRRAASTQTVVRAAVAR